MDEGQTKQTNLVEATDCLEAVGVFKGWKNFLFIVAICCLVLLQASFWLIDRGYVKIEEEKKQPSSVGPKGKEQKEQIEEAAKRVAAQPNQPAEAAPAPEQVRFHWIKIEQLTWLIRFLDFVLILTAILYCLTMLFSLKVSLLGRLGGISYIARAFFLSLTFAVLLLPWQKFFGGVVVGAMYTPKELLSSVAFLEEDGVIRVVLYYLRFTGYWVVVLLLIIFSQLRSAAWARAILRRLEVV